MRWSFARGALWRGYWLLASVYLVVVAGLSASQLVLIGAGQAAMVLLAEVPAGVYADTVSRTRSLVVGHLAIGAGMVMLGAVTSFPALAVSQALCGLGWAFASGADVAWITDELDNAGAISRVLAARARWELVGAATGLVGFGCVAWATDLRTGIVASGLLMLALGVVVAVRFPERRFVPADRRRWRASMSLLGDALHLVRRDREIVLVGAAWLLVNGGSEGYGRLVETRLIGLGFGAGDQPIVWFTALGLATLSLGSVALRIVERRVDDEDVARRTFVASCGAGVVGLALFASAPDARYALAGVVLATGCAKPGAVVRAMTEIWVNRRTTSDVRATVHSLLSLAEHTGKITLGIALAAVAAAGPTGSFVGAGLLFALAGVLVARVRGVTGGPRRTGRGGRPTTARRSGWIEPECGLDGRSTCGPARTTLPACAIPPASGWSAIRPLWHLVHAGDSLRRLPRPVRGGDPMDHSRLSMPLGEAIFTQRSIRRFRPDPIRPEDVRLIIEAAVRAPNGGNQQVARFLVVNDRATVREFGRLYHEAWWAKRHDEGFQRYEDLPRGFHAAAGLADAMVDVPCIVFALAMRHGPADSVIPAVQNLMLAARAIGIGSVPTTLHPSVMDRFRSMFGIPDDVGFHFCVPLGYPQGSFGPNVRKPTSETTYLDRWASPVPWT